MSKAKLRQLQKTEIFVYIYLEKKREYFGNLNIRDISSNKKLWKTIQLLFSQK